MAAIARDPTLVAVTRKRGTTACRLGVREVQGALSFSKNPRHLFILHWGTRQNNGFQALKSRIVRLWDSPGR
jgi:hypothetical protein